MHTTILRSIALVSLTLAAAPLPAQVARITVDAAAPLVWLRSLRGRLAGADIRQSFWGRPVVAPPKGYGRWDALLGALARHLVERSGIGEVRRWYCEVWNEPNLDFWGGERRQST